MSVLRRSVPAPAGERVPGGTFECATTVCPRACGGTCPRGGTFECATTVCPRACAGVTENQGWEGSIGHLTLPFRHFRQLRQEKLQPLAAYPVAGLPDGLQSQHRLRTILPGPGRFLSGYGLRRALRARIRDLRCRPVTRTASSKMVPFFFRPALRYRSLIASKYFLILPRVTPPPGPPEADYLRGKDSLFRNIYYESIREIDRPRKTVLYSEDRAI